MCGEELIASSVYRLRPKIPGHRNSAVPWHQDSGYVGYDHKTYLTCWVTLDDVSEENGTVYLLPYSRAGTRDWVRHVKEEGTNVTANNVFGRPATKPASTDPALPSQAASHGAPARRYLNDKVTGVLLEGMKRLAAEQ